MAKRKPKGTIYYAEFIADRLGEEVHTGWITRNHLREIAANVKGDFEGTLADDAPYDEDLWDKYLISNDTIYLTNEVFYGSNAIRQCAGILRAIESVSGSWGKRVEEGSIAFGLSEQMALDRLDKLEGPSRLR